MEEFGLLMLLGVRVRTVKHLDEQAIWLRRHKLLLIDEDLTPAQRAQVAAAFLPDVLSG